MDPDEEGGGFGQGVHLSKRITEQGAGGEDHWPGRGGILSPQQEAGGGESTDIEVLG